MKTCYLKSFFFSTGNLKATQFVTKLINEHKIPPEDIKISEAFAFLFISVVSVWYLSDKKID